MRFGLMLDPAVDPAEVPDQARHAEQLGFDFVACGEHVFFHGPTANAFVCLAAAATATRRIRLLSALTVLPLYPIGLAAKMAATLDRLSGGRFSLGVGVGGEYPPEFAACGVPLAERGAKTDEALDVLTRLFRRQTVNHHGKHAQLDALALLPPPQAPLPIWVGGRKPPALRRAARFADVWLPYMVTPDMVHTGLDQVREQAQQHGRGADAVQAAVFLWGDIDAAGTLARDRAVQRVSTIYQQDFTPLADKYLLAGTPDTVTARLAQYRQAGATSMVFAPACPPQARTAGVELFAREVIPALTDASTPEAG